MAKNIVVLSDGTGNSASKVWRTNVWRMFESLNIASPNLVAQYDDGVGSSSFKPLAMLGGAFGWGLKRNVLDIYMFLCRNYRDDDQIYAFGFSRGAFTIRVLLGLVVNQGLVPFTSEADLQRKARAAYRAYRGERYHSLLRLELVFRALRNGLIRVKDAPSRSKPYNQSENIQIPSIRFVGLWDTVAAYGLPVEEMTRGVSQWLWPLELPDRQLGNKVLRACHALALDDERTTFHPVLWSEHDEQPPKPAKDGHRYLKDERISQVWFCGAHSNVGGGYPDDSLAHIPLHWIMQEAKLCGLHFKESPQAEPDAIRRAKSAQDIDGRLYDARAGLGGYYRYGPRKIAGLCDMRFSGREEDTVKIAKPKIHETALTRMDSGSQGYAPIGLPGDYAVAMSDGRILEGKDNPFESLAAAKTRSEEQEKIWNLVWLRRVVYFATIAASLHLALFPLVHRTVRAAEYATDFRLISESLRLAGAFLPGFSKWWLDAYATNPGWFAIGVIAIIALIMFGAGIGGRINDRMRFLWQSRKVAKGSSRLPTDLLYRLRTSKPYQWFLLAAKRHVVPLLSALLLLYLGLTLLSHFLFNVQDAAGAFCKGSAQPYKLQLKDSRDRVFDTGSLCWATGWELEEGRRYRIAIKQITPWFDRQFKTDIDGFEIAELPNWKTRVVMFSGLPLRRVFLRPWFRVIARIGDHGTDEYFVDRDRLAKLGNKELQVVFRARRSGELFFYVNDAVIGLPWWTDIFYRNNSGTAKITLQRLDR